MKSSSLRYSLLTLTLGTSLSALAQTLPIEYYRPMKTSFSAGVKMTNRSAKVRFGNVGEIPSGLTSRAGLTTSNRYYANGYILADGDETLKSDGTSYYTYAAGVGTRTYDPATGTNYTQTTTDRRTLIDGGTRFHVERTVVTDYSDTTVDTSVTTIVGDAPIYKANNTRNWSYNTPAQVGGATGSQYVDMNYYDVTSSGASFEAESGSSSGGIELQFARVLQRGRKFEWGITGSFGVDKIEASTSAQFLANLRKSTDRYSFTGSTRTTVPVTTGTGDSALAVTPSNPYVSSSDAETITVITTPDDPLTTDVNEQVSYTYTSANMGYLNTTGVAQPSTTATNGTTVDGKWSVKGAYYLVRLGPQVRFPITKRITASLSAGFAGAYIGTTYEAQESTTVADRTGALTVSDGSRKTAFVAGAYADANLEFWASTRTGIYVGATYESLGSYTQKLYNRTADIDLGKGTGFRIGIITRF